MWPLRLNDDINLNRWKRPLAASAIVTLCIFGYYFEAKGSPDATLSNLSDTGSLETQPQPIDGFIRELFQSEKVAIDAPSFTDIDGDTYSLPHELIHHKSLGKRICILDIDTRPFEGKGQLLHPADWQWPNVDHLSAGIMSHYLYSQIHGYSYLLLRAPSYADRHAAWAKVLLTQHALPSYDLVLFMDSDAILPVPELPLEWLLNYWAINTTVSIALASESLLPRDRDARGNPGQNTGFMIVQNNPHTHELYKAWAECPEETRYPGCAKWKQAKLREQSAFSEYVRYDPAFEPWIRILPCTEGNGYPEQYAESGCKGVFVRHHWMHKQLTRDVLGESVMRVWAKKMHRWYMGEGMKESGFIEDMRMKTLVGSRIVDLEDY